MAYKRLTTGEMIQLSGPWVTPGTQPYKVLRSIPETAVVMPRLAGAHEMLLGMQPVLDGDGLLARLTGQATALDASHDGFARAVNMIISGFALLPTLDPAMVEALGRLRDLVLPDGLTIVQRSYREEAGAARMLATRLTGDARAQLRKLHTPGGTLEEIVEQWMATAHKLGEVEDQRARAMEQAALGPAAADVVKGRNQWIRAVTAIVTGLELAEVDAATAAIILGPLRDAERTADRRAGRGGEAATDPPPPAPNPPQEP